MEQINQEAFKKFKGSEINSLEKVKGGGDTYEMVGCGGDTGNYERNDYKIFGRTIYGRWHEMP